MQTPSNITVIHNAEESVVNFEGGIEEIKLDGKKLSDIHELTIKVEGIAQSIKTLILCLGVILVISLICNIGMATWVFIHDGDIIDAIRQVLSTNWQYQPKYK